MDKKENLSKDSTISAKLFALILNMSGEDQINLYEELKERVARGKRTHPRKAFFSLVQYATQDALYKDFIKDISEGGVYIETSVPFTVGQVISLTFPIPNQQEHIKIVGEVARVGGQGIGVKFKMSGEEQGIIMKTLLSAL